MYLLYLDDSGSPKNPREEHFVLGGLSVFERQTHWISKQMDDLAEQVAPQGIDPLNMEFHASEIRRGKTPPWKGMQTTDRFQVIRSVLDILANAHQTTSAFTCAVHRPSYPHQDPVELAFEQLCNRFDLQLKRFYSQGDAQRGIIIIDETTRQEAVRRLASDFKTLGTRWGTIRNLAELPLFVTSCHSRLLQLADHVAYATFRRYERGDSSFLDLIAHRFDAEGPRIHGLVHQHTLLQHCRCPACTSRL